MKSNKVLVTGATGFVGNALLRELKKNGYEIAVLTRDQKRARAKLPVYCQIHECDLNYKVPMASTFEGVTAVVHLAGENIGEGRWTPARKERIRKSRVRATKNLVEGMSSLKTRPEVFISASATGFFGDRGDERLDENSSQGSGFLSRVCREWEEKAEQALSLGIRTAIYRFGVVLGFDGGAMKKMWAPFQLGFGGRLGSGRQWMSWIHVQDLARALVHAIGHGKMEGTFNAVAPNPVTNRTFTREMEQAMNQIAPFPIPALALKILLGEMSQILLCSQWVSSRQLEQTGFVFKFPELPMALNEICSHTHHEICMEQWVPSDRKKTFRFFEQPRNLEKVSPPSMSLTLEGTPSEKLVPGDLIPFKFNWYGIPIRWVTRVQKVLHGQHFSDSQVDGPFSVWNHSHDFESRNGGTLIRDHIQYCLPFGVLGDLIVGDRVRIQIEENMGHRAEKMETILA